jgi:hypothetical protein
MDDLMGNWFLIFTTDKSYEAAIAKGKLEENGIPVLVVNRQDSSYIVIGEIELYVPVQLKDVAKDLLNNAFTN